MISFKRVFIKYFSIKYLFIPFILITVFSGIVSFYAVYNYNRNILNIIDSVETAKDIQIELQKQFNSWKIIIVEGHSFEVYREKIHEYSYNAQHIQNSLFNLGLMCKDMEDVHIKIVDFTHLYKEMNDELLSYIVNYNDTNSYDYKKLVNSAVISEKKLLQMMEVIVADIERTSNEKVNLLNRYYLITGFISFGLLTLFTLIISWYSTQLIDRFKKKLEFKVKKRTEQLQKANEVISLSEQKYRFLIESTDDIVFTIDPQGTIVSINNAIKKDLKMKPSDAIGSNIFDYIYFEDDNNSFKKQMLMKNIELALNEKQKVRFYAELKTPRMIEPVEMVISLESVKHNGGMEIIGKATKMMENELVSAFVHEHVKYEITNSLLLADEITHRIVQNVKKFLPHTVVSQIRLAVSEILINAIEHGNLEITYQDKLLKMQNDEYFEYISKKINERSNKDKKVKVEFLVNSEKIIVKITDQGKGFDYKSYLDKPVTQDNEMFLQHGRGISLARQIFDEIRYNDKGNQVLCVKYFTKECNEETQYNNEKMVVY
ncbi:MAG: ATP-binding protein [Spirochaetes bacterium]|nr:ATP-binding protein [Spirochaetota bacterium]